MDLDQLNLSFDTIFTRLVLVHVPDPLATIKLFFEKLKPNGLLACEETVLDKAYCKAPLACFDQHINLLLDYANKIGVNFNLDKELTHLFQQADFANIVQTTAQPIMTSPELKAIVPLSAAACAPAYYQ